MENSKNLLPLFFGWTKLLQITEDGAERCLAAFFSYLFSFPVAVARSIYSYKAVVAASVTAAAAAGVSVRDMRITDKAAWKQNTVLQAHE